MTRFGRLRLGYLWALLEPVFFVGFFFLLFAIMGRGSASGMSLTPFLLTGAMPYILFRDSLQAGVSAINQNRMILTFPQVTLFDLVLARTLLEFATHSLASILLIVGIVLLLEPIRIEDPILVVFWFLMAGILGFGAGLGLGSFAVLIPSIVRLIPNFIIRPLMFLSGMFFTVEMIPESVRNYALHNPLLHITENIRSAFFYEYESAHASFAFPVLFTIAAIFIGMAIQRAFRRKILAFPTG